MAGHIFVTGAGGFIGSQLVKRLADANSSPIYCLYRKPGSMPVSVNNGNVKAIYGELGDPAAYASYLADCDTVVHLAAATGKTEKESYYSVNAGGTQTLVEQSELAGVRNFLYISTIAVKYPDITRYDYAKSKAQAEEIVRGSGLNYCIVRPTIVLGHGSPIWENLYRLAKMPVVPYFGDASTKIQPIYVDDLVNCLAALLLEHRFGNETIELGGPQIITFHEFMDNVHKQSKGTKSRIVQIPFKPLRAALSVLEAPLYKWLPVTIGQLSAFNYDGTIHPNWLHTQCADQMMGVTEIIRRLISYEPAKTVDDSIERECQVFTQYLIGENPSAYVVEKYKDAHIVSVVYNVNGSDAFENFLVKLASQNPIFARIVDAFASIFYKKSLLRRKLILLLAILENSAPFYTHFDTPDSNRVFGVVVRLAFHGFVFLVSLILGAILVIFARVYFSIRWKSLAKVGESWAG